MPWGAEHALCRQAASIIVAAPPGGGKTTVLRDLARALSGGFGGRYRKVSIVDERGEFGGFSPGVNTDVLTGFGKKKGIEIAVRTLSPELIVCDEIADDAEVDAIKAGFSSGVAFARVRTYSGCGGPGAQVHYQKAISNRRI